MATPKLIVSGQDEAREIELVKHFVVIGRSSECDVVLPSDRVSRHHARLFEDPFGRWILEDLGSRNGTWLEGRRVRAEAVLPGQGITIRPFVLTFAQDIVAPGSEETTSLASSTLVADDDSVEIVRRPAEARGSLSADRLHRLNEIIAELGEVTTSAELYPTTCRLLAPSSGATAVVLRIPKPPVPLPPSPAILAMHAGAEADGTPAAAPERACFSRGVLEAVRATGEPVLATNAETPARHVSLTVHGSNEPRSVLAVVIARLADDIDVLYVDAPQAEGTVATLDFLHVVAQQVGFSRKGLQLSDLKAEQRVIEHQLSVARSVQSHLTPDASAAVAGAEIAVHYEPAMWVGGDYCDVWMLTGGRQAFAVGDVAGKGLPAAMVMSNVQAAMRTTLAFCPDLALAARHINDHLLGSFTTETFVTMFVGLFDPADGRLQYVNAGHLWPLLVGPDGKVRTLHGPGNLPIGVEDMPCEAGRRQLRRGEGIVVVTDGITDASSPQHARLGMEGLRRCLRESAPRTAEEMVQAVVRAAKEFRQHAPQHDDVTAFALVYRGADEGPDA